MLMIVVSTAISIVFTQYTVDNLFLNFNHGILYGIQLMPEAKLLVDSSGPNEQPFVNNYFSFSVGFCITLGYALLYGLIFSMNQKQAGYLQGLKVQVILAFFVGSILIFLKPYIHMTSQRRIWIDGAALNTKFHDLELFTPEVAIAFGIIAYSSTLSQQICVPELLMRSKEDQIAPMTNYFGLPLAIANFLAFILKCSYGIIGAMMFTDQSNVFDNQLFSSQESNS